MAIDASTYEAVNNANYKSIAEMGVINALQSQQRLSILAEKALSKSLESMDNTSVAEGLGEAISATVGFQQAIKSAGNTPPVTP